MSSVGYNQIQSMMIRASAGSGKTWQLANRFLALMVLGVQPEKIIALKLAPFILVLLNTCVELTVMNVKKL